MPGGSDYQGPPEALEQYADIVARSDSDTVVKGAKNPYTSLNGHMFSFLDVDGSMAIRLSETMQEEFLSKYESGPVIQYGSVMRGYVSVPEALFANTNESAYWFDRSREWIATLDPKPTKGRK